MTQTELFINTAHQSLPKHKNNPPDPHSLNERYKIKAIPYLEIKDNAKRSLNRSINSKSQLERSKTLNFNERTNQISSQKFIGILDLMRKRRTSHFALPLNSYAAKMSESRKIESLVIGIHRKILFEKLDNSGSRIKKNKFKILEKMVAEVKDEANQLQVETPETDYTKHLKEKNKTHSFDLKLSKCKRESEGKNSRFSSIEKERQRNSEEISKMCQTLSEPRYPCEIKQITLREKESIVLKKICKKENKKHMENFNASNWRRHKNERKKSELCPWEIETHFLTE